ncbi:unnamed protein product [Arabis nemorensis]|uniref:Uncharacterized protein n=1 Tax=Arabis nemorensis TaxID=586526 RepID=A0A565B389_9BRAS|nr:unnamed protein product [Arabis nemorensis]
MQCMEESADYSEALLKVEHMLNDRLLHILNVDVQEVKILWQNGPVDIPIIRQWRLIIITQRVDPIYQRTPESAPFCGICPEDFFWALCQLLYSRDDLDSELGSVDLTIYTVQIPQTPDHQPMDPSISQKVEEQYMFVHGRDCFVDAVNTGGMCPGCKEPYRNKDLTDLADNNNRQKQQRPMLPPPAGGSKMERRSSLMKSGLMRSQTGDFDHNRWLFETTGTYGYGNAFWTKDGNFGTEKDGNGQGIGPQDLMSRPWRPLTRKLPLPAAAFDYYPNCCSYAVLDVED